MLLKSFTVYSIVLSVASILAGCGGGGDSPTPDTTPPSPPPTPSTKLVAMDGFSTVKPDTATVVDLSSFVRSLDADVVSAEALGDNSDCGVPIPQGLGLNITAKSGAYCDYRYEARSGNSQSSAVLRVLATEASEPMLPPISQAMILSDPPKTFNLETLLGANWPTGYHLNTDSVEVQGDKGNLGTVVTATGNEITFKGPELSGWNRVVYSINNPAKPEEDKMGAIYVTISQDANQPPHIGSPKYTYTGNVTTAENVVMNLATLQGLNISETNNEDWQLIEVQSFTANVEAMNVDSVTNKSFSFTAPTVGEHFVSYIIADHYNGYATGLIKVNVQAKGGPVTWAAITHDDIYFTAPQTYTKAQTEGFNVAAVWDEGVTNTIAGYLPKRASNYCDTLGGLPTKANLVNLRNGFLTSGALSGELAKWPALKPYLVRDGSDFKGIALSTGLESAYSPNDSYYVTCIKNSDISLTPLASKVVANGGPVSIARVTVPKVSDSFTLARVDGTLSTAEAGVYAETEVGKDSNIIASSTKTGTYRFSVTNDEDAANTVNSPLISFIADEATAAPSQTVEIASAPVNFLSNQEDETKIEVLVADAHHNVIPYSPVFVSLSSSTASYRTEPASGKTDAEGKMYIFVKDSIKENVAVTASLSSSKASPGDAVSTALVKFVNQYPCQDGSFNCLPVVESKTRKGVLFTAGVSTPYMLGINYREGGYTPNFFTENGSAGPNGFSSAGFTWQQSRDWCTYLGIKNYAGRSNWAQPSMNDLLGLYNSNGESPLGMFTAFGWPTSGYYNYWSATAISSGYYNVDIGIGVRSYNYPNETLNASCISLPEADLSTAEFSVSKGLVVDTNDALSNGVAQNQVTATLTDGVGVPVSGVKVTAVITDPSLGGGGADSASISYENQVTDVNGQSVIKIVNKEAETVQIKVTAEPDGRAIESKSVLLTFKQPIFTSYPCNGVAGNFNCLPVVESKTRKGVLFTAGVSTPYMEGIDYRGGYTPNLYTETGSFGPNGFSSAGFTWQQGRDWCAYLGAQNYAGRSNWAQPSMDDLVGLYDTNGESSKGMFTSNGWPTTYDYWSATADGSYYRSVDLSNGTVRSNGSAYAPYASCVSVP